MTSKERSSIEDIRARAAQPVTEIVANPREYYRVQQLLRDRADLLAYYDELRTPTEQCNCPPGTCVKGTNDDVTCRKDPSTAHEPPAPASKELCWLERLRVEWMALWLSEENFAAWLRANGLRVRVRR
jgi:hypothetical protein